MRLMLARALLPQPLPGAGAEQAVKTSLARDAALGDQRWRGLQAPTGRAACAAPGAAPQAQGLPPECSRPLASDPVHQLTGAGPAGRPPEAFVIGERRWGCCCGRGPARCHGGRAQPAPSCWPRSSDRRQPYGLGGGEQRPTLPSRAGGTGE